MLDLENLVEISSRSPGAHPDRNELDSGESSLLREMQANNRQSSNSANVVNSRSRVSITISTGDPNCRFLSNLAKCSAKLPSVAERWSSVRDRRLALCAFFTILLLYVKLRFEFASLVSWLLVFSVPWMYGIFVLFKVAIPSMLESTERALSAQHSSDCNATALARQPLRIRGGSREWDELTPDGPAGEAAGYWAGWYRCVTMCPRPYALECADLGEFEQERCRALWRPSHWHFSWAIS